jgi:hypothetical protein
MGGSDFNQLLNIAMHPGRVHSLVIPTGTFRCQRRVAMIAIRYDQGLQGRANAERK